MSTASLTLRTLCVLLLSALPLAGCGDDPPEHEDPNAEACEHFEMGPPAALTAAAASGADAPKINNDHKRYDVMLVDVSGKKGGYVSFAAASEGDFIFFTSAGVKLSVKGASGDVAAEASLASIKECDLVKGRHVYPLKVGTYVIGIEAETGDKVSFVVEADAH